MTAQDSRGHAVLATAVRGEEREGAWATFSFPSPRLRGRSRFGAAKSRPFLGERTAFAVSRPPNLSSKLRPNSTTHLPPRSTRRLPRHSGPLAMLRAVQSRAFWHRLHSRDSAPLPFRTAQPAL